METKTGIKIFLLILLSLWIVFAIPQLVKSGGESIAGDIAILIFGIIVPIGFTVALVISIINDIKRNKAAEREKTYNQVTIDKQISLTRNILNIAAVNNRPLSVYDFMMQIQESEEKIESELEHFVEKGLAERMTNEKGPKLYKFLLSSPDNQCKGK